jgi:hypothetical protein
MTTSSSRQHRTNSRYYPSSPTLQHPHLNTPPHRPSFDSAQTNARSSAPNRLRSCVPSGKVRMVRSRASTRRGFDPPIARKCFFSFGWSRPVASHVTLGALVTQGFLVVTDQQVCSPTCLPAAASVLLRAVASTAG